ncbi:hypothetical protein [Pseudoclavibacter sp. JSM 162008]|uniref:hypothetical protein n=1 Tax=Pseudoclavibacter sp. JSM 162008 TaxID=3229855 RepID=UPI0035264095
MPKTKRLGLLIGASALVLAGCTPAWNVNLNLIWDTEASDVLTNQRDATSEICGISSECTQALSSDQGTILKFDSAEKASSEAEETDQVVREVFLFRWDAETPQLDREIVVEVLNATERSA